MFILAPFVVFVPTLLVFLVVPFSDKWIVKDLNLGVLFVDRRLGLPGDRADHGGVGLEQQVRGARGDARGGRRGLSYEIPLRAGHGVRGGGGRLACGSATS